MALHAYPKVNCSVSCATGMTLQPISAISNTEDTYDAAENVRPPHPPWCELQTRDDAGGFLTIFLRDELSGMAVRAVTLPGNNKSDPNIETGTYGLFSTCCQDMRAGVVARGCRWLFFLTRQHGHRVLAGYYRIRWHARGPLLISGRSADYVLAADDVRFVHPAIPVQELPAAVRTDVQRAFRTVKHVDSTVVDVLLRTLNARPNATSMYIDEIHRLERFNAYRTSYRYVGWRMRRSFGWDMAEQYVTPASTHAPRTATPSATGASTDVWLCAECRYQFVNKALLKRCPRCGRMATLQPAPTDH